MAKPHQQHSGQRLPEATCSAVLSINRTSCSHEPDYIGIQIKIGRRVIKLSVTPEQFALALTGVSERPCGFSDNLHNV